MRDESAARRRKTLVIYLMCGPETPELAEAAVAGGADLVELGFPFSDPLADGPVIRRAAERALARGMRTQACLECLAATRERLPETPLVPMTYSSLLEAYGWERFADFFYTAVSTAFISPPGDILAHSRGARAATMIEMLTAFALITAYASSFVDWQRGRADADEPA